MMKMKVGLSLEEITVQRINAMAAGTKREKSAIVDLAIELLSMQDEFANLKVSPRTSRKSTVRKPNRKPNIDSIVGVKRGLTQVA